MLILLQEEIFNWGTHQPPKTGTSSKSSTTSTPSSASASSTTKALQQLKNAQQRQKQRAKSFDFVEELGNLRNDVDSMLTVRRSRNASVEDAQLADMISASSPEGDFHISPLLRDIRYVSKTTSDGNLDSKAKNLPRTSIGLRTLQSAIVMYEVRSLVLSEDFDELQNIFDDLFLVGGNGNDNDDDNDDNDNENTSTRTNSITTSTFEPYHTIKDELKQVRVFMATKKYVPLLNELMAPSADCAGPVGEMDPRSLIVDELGELLSEAKHNLCNLDGGEGEEVVKEAEYLFEVRALWRNEEWLKLVNLTSKSITRTRGEILWASVEASDQLFQSELNKALEIGKLRGDNHTATKTILKSDSGLHGKLQVDTGIVVAYEHVAALLKFSKNGFVPFSISEVLDEDYLVMNMEMDAQDDEDEDENTDIKELKNIHNRQSKQTKQLIDTALFTIELRKYQELEDWEAVKLFCDGKDELTVAGNKKDANHGVKTKVAKDCEDLRAMLADSGLRPKTAAAPASPSSSSSSSSSTKEQKYPLADFDILEAHSAKNHACKKILQTILVPALSTGGPTGSVGNIDCSNIETKELKKAIKASKLVSIEGGEQGGKIIDYAEAICEWRHLMKTCKGNFSNVWKIHREKMDNLTIPLRDELELLEEEDPELFRDIANDEEPSISSPFVYNEIKLVVEQCKYMKALSDIPEALSVGMAGGEVGETIFEEIDEFAIISVLENLKVSRLLPWEKTK